MPRRPLLFAAALVASLPAAGARAGMADGQAFFDQGEWRKAMAELRPLADSGSAPAQFLVATMLDEGGHGVVPDKQAALDWYTRAAEQDHPGAEYALFLYYSVTPGPQNQRQEKAMAWAERLAGAGPRLTGDDRQQAALSAHTLGTYYQRGLSTEGDPAAAYRWYLIAERLGWAESAAPRQALAQSLPPAERAAAEAAAQQWWTAHGGR